MIVSIVAALSSNRVIGLNNDLPWHLPEDLAHFKKLTSGHHVVMGRRSYESLPKKYQPLPGRTNLVLTKTSAKHSLKGAHIFQNLDAALRWAQQQGETEIFIAGGETVFQESMQRADRLYLTRVDANVRGDRVFPPIDPVEWQKHSEDKKKSPDPDHRYGFTIEVWHRKAAGRIA